MGIVQDSIRIYEEIRKYEYYICLENGMDFTLRFKRENYHHLAGFQYLLDFPDISAPTAGMQKFYSDIKKGRIQEQTIERSVKYSVIEERLEGFSMMEDILKAGEGKIIVEFNPQKVDSKIEAKFLLFKRHGIPFKGDATYYSLFIDCSNDCKNFFPVSFLVEHSPLYIRNQKTFYCTISRKLLKKEKRLSPV